MNQASSKIRPFRFALLYVLASSAWIAITDLLVAKVRSQPTLSIFKGWLFVAVTGLLLYVLLLRVRLSLEAIERKMRATNDRFRLVVENAPEGIFVQTGGKFRYLNRAALECFGAGSPDRLLGSPVIGRFHKDFHATVQDRIHRLNELRQSVPIIEEKCLRLDGTEFYAEVGAVHVDYDGENGALVFFRDVTARKKAESERLRLEEQFRQSQKMESIGRLAGGVAHDFNNYLTVINGYAEFLLSKTDLNSSFRGPLDQIRLAGERAAGMTKQLLAFSRKEEADIRPLELNKAVRGVEKMLRRLLGEDIEVVTSLSHEPCHILADEGWIGQVLMNLAVNSRDAMPNGGRISIQTHRTEIDEAGAHLQAGARPGMFVILEVKDTGAGMDEESLSHIFEPFFTTKKPGEGTGLGLASVYSIVKRCEGWISVTSQVGVGTSFRIYLPLYDGEEVPPARNEGGTVDQYRGSETVLLVEDQENVRHFIEDTLRSLGYDVLPAAGGEEALAVADSLKGPIHLIITDVLMPGMNGRDVMERFRTARPEAKVLFMSGFTAGLLPSHEYFPEYRTPCLHKPFLAETLARRVYQILHEVPAQRSERASNSGQQ